MLKKKKKRRYKSIYKVKGYRNIECGTFSKEAIKSVLAALVLYFILHAVAVYITYLTKYRIFMFICSFSYKATKSENIKNRQIAK